MISGKNMKERILRLLSDGRWHSSLEIALAVGRGGPAWSWNQRKNELINDDGFHIERKIDELGRFLWRLTDPTELIDFENLCLREPAALQELLVL